MARILAETIVAEPRLELLAPVALSAVCFRYVGGTGEVNALNRAILNSVIQRGRVYISNAMIHGMFALRACVVNHRTSEEDVKAVVTEVLAAADELMA